MKLYALSILYKGDGDKVTKLATGYDVSTFGYFTRTGVREFMDFTMNLVVERTPVCQRSSIKEQDYMCHVYVRGDNLAGVLLSDHEYPQRVGFTLLNKVLDEFACQYPVNELGEDSESSISFTKCNQYLAQYQNPKEADALTRLQADLDETKIILHNTIQDLLRRGETLENLAQRSDYLSMQSKEFFKQAKQTNRCCVIL